MLKDDLGLNCQPTMSDSHYVSISKILWLLTRTTLVKILLNWNTVMHHLQFYLKWSIPSWLALRLHKYLTVPKKIFRYRIKNSDSLTSKHSELLASHQGSLKSERHMYPYTIRVTFDSRVLWKWSYSVKCTSINHPYAISVSPHILVKRTTN